MNFPKGEKAVNEFPKVTEIAKCKKWVGTQVLVLFKNLYLFHWLLIYFTRCHVFSVEYHFRHRFVLSLILTKYPKIITLYKTSSKVATPLSWLFLNFPISTYHLGMHLPFCSFINNFNTALVNVFQHLEYNQSFFLTKYSYSDQVTQTSQC